LQGRILPRKTPNATRRKTKGVDEIRAPLPSISSGILLPTNKTLDCLALHQSTNRVAEEHVIAYLIPWRLPPAAMAQAQAGESSHRSRTAQRSGRLLLAGGWTSFRGQGHVRSNTVGVWLASQILLDLSPRHNLQLQGNFIASEMDGAWVVGGARQMDTAREEARLTTTCMHGHGRSIPSYAGVLFLSLDAHTQAALCPSLTFTCAACISVQLWCDPPS
jgi:hypothetical protein